MVTQNRRLAKRAYDAKTKQVIFRLRLDKDADILAKFESVPSKVDYLRMLVRTDIRRNADV